MNIIKAIIFSLSGILALLLIVAIFVRKEFHLSREITIAKPVKEVFGYLKMLKNQNNFSKWALVDPSMKKEYRGTDGTVGFISTWESPVKEVGKGEQEITAIREGERIDYRLRFQLPRKSEATAYMETKAASEGSTLVKWGFEGKMNYPFNLTLLFLDLDKLIGKDLEQGLTNLKPLLEKQ